MLSALSTTAARVVRAGTHRQSGTSAQEADCLYVDLDVCRLLHPLPALGWARVAEICTQAVAPVYRAVRDTLHDDMQHLAFILEGPQDPSQHIWGDGIDISPGSPGHVGPKTEHDKDHCAGSDGPFPAKDPLFISEGSDTVVWLFRDADGSLPSIVVTLSPSQPRNHACLVPFQDASFGNRLAVPMHPALNSVYPPLVAQPFPIVRRWRYEKGHWRALLPDLEEQNAKGMFSRPSPPARRRRMRSPMR